MAILFVLTIILILAGLWRAAAMCPLLQMLALNFDSWADGARDGRH